MTGTFLGIPTALNALLQERTKGWKKFGEDPVFWVRFGFVLSARKTFPAVIDLHLHSYCHGGAGPECRGSGLESSGRIYPQTTGTKPQAPVRPANLEGTRVYRPGEGISGCVESRVIAPHKSAIAVCLLPVCTVSQLLTIRPAPVRHFALQILESAINRGFISTTHF